MDKKIKVGLVGIGGMGKEPRADIASLRAFIDQFNKTAEIYAKEGFRLTYHHHNYEFARIDGYKTIMDILVENLDPKNTSFVLDTCWLAAGGVDVCYWIEKLAGRVDILHLKDMYLKPIEKKFYPEITEVGHGNVSFPAAIAAAKKIGVTNYIVEQDNNFSPNAIASLAFSAEYLKPFMDK